MALAWLIDHIRTSDPGKRTALLLNGDVFDFLADLDTADEFNLDAGGTIRRLASDPGLKPIFVALAAFVRQPNRFLVIQIGNHDIELAVPDVLEALRQAIDPDRTAPAEQLIFESSRRGWGCRVAQRYVLAVHGNASDPWNFVDLEALEQFATGAIAKPPPANAGTTLVVQVMNAVKKQFPFVDILKPETAPLIAVLNAVNAKQSTSGLLRALGRLNVQRGLVSDLLSMDDSTVVKMTDAERAILDTLKAVPVPTDGRARLRKAEENLEQGISPRDLIGEEGRLQAVGSAVAATLQRIGAAIDRLRGEPEQRSLRKALQGWLDDDRTFAPTAMSSIDRRIASSAPSGVHCLLAGHTHLPRIGTVSGMQYLNTGTWMRVLKLQNSPYLQDDTKFGDFFTACKAGTLSALDALNLDPRSRPVAVVDDKGARLQSVIEAGATYQLGPLRTGA